MSDTRKDRRAHRLAQRREERSQRESGSSSRGASRNVLIAAGVVAVIAVIALGIVVVGLGNQEATTTAGGANTAASDADDRFPIVAYPPGVAAIGPDEREFTELLGTGTPVVLNFWAGQCPPCRAEMPAFQRVYDTFGEDFLLLGVDIGPFIGLGTTQSAIDLLAELDITYPTARSVDARPVRDYDVLGMPTTIFYDGDGVEVTRQVGLLTEDALESRVRDLVGA